MPDETRPIPPDEYRIIAKHVPIVSVDLLVHHDGGILLGKRLNEPAKGEWFVPGGAVYKGETRREAVARVAREELGASVEIEEELGTFEHFYDTAASEGVDSKQYLATGYLVELADTELERDTQHSDLRVFQPPFSELHPYVRSYIETARDLGYSVD